MAYACIIVRLNFIVELESLDHRDSFKLRMLHNWVYRYMYKFFSISVSWERDMFIMHYTYSIGCIHLVLVQYTPNIYKCAFSIISVSSHFRCFMRLMLNLFFGLKIRLTNDQFQSSTHNLEENWKWSVSYWLNSEYS